LEPKPERGLPAGGKRRHPRGDENTGLGADKPEAQRLWQEYEAFAARDLSQFVVAHLFIDGVAARLHVGLPREAVLCAWGILEEGLLLLAPRHQRRHRELHGILRALPSVAAVLRDELDRAPRNGSRRPSSARRCSPSPSCGTE
jgi:hypothetical protein